MHGNEDRGWLIARSLTVAVYEDKDFAEKEAEWLTNFQKRCGTKTQYKVAKWLKEEGVETEVQTPPSSRRSTNSVDNLPMPKRSDEKKSKPAIPESSEAAPRSMIPNDLSVLFTGNSDMDGTP